MIHFNKKSVSFLHRFLSLSVFGCYKDGTIFGSETGDRPMSRPKTEAEAEPSPTTTYGVVNTICGQNEAGRPARKMTRWLISSHSPLLSICDDRQVRLISLSLHLEMALVKRTLPCLVH